MNWLVKLVTENVWLKLLSLALAGSLWAAVGADPITEATFRVPLEFINVPPNLELLTEQPTVQLWARGTSHAVRTATAGDFVVRVNVAPMSGPGERTFFLDPAGVGASTPLHVVEVIPSQVKVTLEENLSKVVPIDPRFSGELPPGYRMKEFRLKPSQAQISGPGSHVNALVVASTGPIDLTHWNGEKTLVTNLSIADPLVRIVQPRSVEITLGIEKAGAPRGGRSSRSGS